MDGRLGRWGEGNWGGGWGAAALVFMYVTRLIFFIYFFCRGNHKLEEPGLEVLMERKRSNFIANPIRQIFCAA